MKHDALLEVNRSIESSEFVVYNIHKDVAVAGSRIFPYGIERYPSARNCTLYHHDSFYYPSAPARKPRASPHTHRIRAPKVTENTRAHLEYKAEVENDADIEDDLDPTTRRRQTNTAFTVFVLSKTLTLTMDNNNNLTPGTTPGSPRVSRPRRRSALAIAERVTAMAASLRRGSNATSSDNRSRSRSGSDAVSPQSLGNGHLGHPLGSGVGGGSGGGGGGMFSRSRGTSRDHSGFTTEDDKEESSEDVHSVDDSLEFGLLEYDPFANLSTPPSECHSPITTTRTWLQNLSTDVIQEEPEHVDDPEEKRKSTASKRASTTSALHIKFLSKKHEDASVSDGDLSALTHEANQSCVGLPNSREDTDHSVRERKRSNSFTERVRHIVQSRPSLPSLSILANTKIFLPTSSKGGPASRFPSEPWDDPKWTNRDRSKTIHTSASIRTATSRQDGEGNRSLFGGSSGGPYKSQGRRDDSSGDGHFQHFSRGNGQYNGHGAGGAGGQPPSHSDSSSRTTSEDNTTATNSDEEDSDDKPLGARPNALHAQKSLRKRIKDERRTRKETLKSKPNPVLPGISRPTGNDPLHPDDLTARLLRLRSSDTASLPASPTGRTAFPTLSVVQNSMLTSPRTSTSQSQQQSRSPIREQISLPNKSTTPSSSSAPMSTFLFPSSAPHPPLIQRNTSERYTPSAPPESGRPRAPLRSMTSFDDVRTARPGASFEIATSQPTQATFSVRSRADTLVQKLSPSSVTSKLRQRSNSLHSSRAPMPAPQQPLPPLPPLTQAFQDRSSLERGSLMQQRIFIGDMQRFSVIEIGQRTNARDVLQQIQDRGDITTEELSSGDWMLFEIANDFGMERPVREYEVLMEIYNSWNSDMRVNYFMLKRTPLTPYLAANAIPKMSPTFSGYVEWEYKRGKWTKRWLELREHSLWLSKRQGAKDATVLCALSNFDAYTVTRIHKSPKPFIFSMKSVQNMRLFENMTDYHHVFCCDPFEGAQWIHHILVARAYVLHQERAVLFRQLSTSKSAPSNSMQTRSPKSGSSAPLISFGSAIPPQQIHTPSSHLHSPPLDGFQPIPGSLLSKRA